MTTVVDPRQAALFRAWLKKRLYMGHEIMVQIN